MATEDVFKVSLFYHTSQRQMIATHYYEVGAVTTTDPFDEGAALAQAFGAAFGGPYALALSTGTNLGCIKIEKVKGDDIPTFVTHLENLDGLRTGDPLPANMSVIIRRRGVFLAKPRRSLLNLGGVSVDDTEGSFLEASYVNGAMTNLLVLYNNQLVASSPFQLAEFNPVMPHTVRVYARDVPVTSDLSANTMTLTDGSNWSDRGFITGDHFRINAPSRNKGTYSATVTPLSATVALADNELEFAGPEVLSAQQATVPVTYFTLFSAVVNTAVRQLNRRRSSHTGIVA